VSSENDAVPMLLKSFLLTSAARIYPSLQERAAKEGWTHRQFVENLLLVEVQDRKERLTQRLLKKASLPVGKTLSALQEELLPLKIRRQLPNLLEGGFLKDAVNVLAFGLPGRGKTHFLAALGHELILRHQKRVLFTATFKLVGQLLQAKANHKLNEALKKLDGFDVVILDDIGYVQQSREEMEVLFTFMAERYERKSLMISSNLVFSQWDKIFKDPMTTMAAIDRVVHHSIILEFDSAESIRTKKNNKPKESITP
jgi:DNA replication protein DnaC